MDMFRAYIYKLFRSPLTFIGVLGVTAICCTNFLLRDSLYYHADVVYNAGILLDFGVFRKVAAVFGAFGFTANFADEWTSGVTIGCVIKKGVRRYAVVNLLFCWFTALLTVFLGMMIFMGALSLFIPVYLPSGNHLGLTVFDVFLQNGQAWIYLTLRILVFSSSCALWAVMGMLLSVFLPNKFAAICAPFVISYVAEQLSYMLPTDLNVFFMSLSRVGFEGSPFPRVSVETALLGLLCCIGVFVLVSVVCGLVFYVFVRKRVQNELT